jgi:hypothetical protein
MGAAMRVRRDVVGERDSQVMRRSRAGAWSPGGFVKGGLVAFVIALGLMAAVNGLITHAPGARANPMFEVSQDCSARYAALLDLAELARRDGKSSEIVVRGLSERGGAMSACLPAGHGEPAPQ